MFATELYYAIPENARQRKNKKDLDQYLNMRLEYNLELVPTGKNSASMEIGHGSVKFIKIDLSRFCLI